jgi:hypothetical protein
MLLDTITNVNFSLNVTLVYKQFTRLTVLLQACKPAKRESETEIFFVKVE